MGIFRNSLAGLILFFVGTAQAAAACDPARADLRGDFGQVSFRVEVADDAAERAQGLMFVESMPRSAGMLFIYPRPRTLSFWMRNTLIPLDMLFIDASGVVRHIHANAIPLDETPITGPTPAVAVLEINGGLSAQLGLREGAQIRHFGLPQSGAVWPCE